MRTMKMKMKMNFFIIIIFLPAPYYFDSTQTSASFCILLSPFIFLDAYGAFLLL